MRSKSILVVLAATLAMPVATTKPDTTAIAGNAYSVLNPITTNNVSSLQRVGGWQQEQVNHLAWSPDGSALAIASIANTAVVLRNAQGGVLETLTGHTAGVRSVAFNRDGALLASASNDGTARVWRVRDGRLQCVVKHTDQVIAVAFNPRRSILASGGDDGVIILTSTSNCVTLRRIKIGKVVASLTFNSRGTMLASGGQSQVIQLWNPDTGAKMRELTGHAGWVWSLAFNPKNDNLLASAGTGDLLRSKP